MKGRLYKPSSLRARSVVILAIAVPAIGYIAHTAFTGHRQIQFVIPDDFRGPFAIVEDRTGAVLDAYSKTARIEIPKSRIMVVRSGRVLREMRGWSASFVSGKPIGVYEVDDDDIALRGGGFAGGTSHPSRFEFFVGTNKEFEAFDFSQWNPREQ